MGEAAITDPVAINRALFADDCQRLREWAQIGPVQRAELESFAERLLAAERERCAKLCELESVVLSTRDQTRGALYCAAKIRA